VLLSGQTDGRGSCADAPLRSGRSSRLFRLALLPLWESCLWPPGAVDPVPRGDVGLVCTQVSCQLLSAQLPDVRGVDLYPVKG